MNKKIIAILLLFVTTTLFLVLVSTQAASTRTETVVLGDMIHQVGWDYQYRFGGVTEWQGKYTLTLIFGSDNGASLNVPDTMTNIYLTNIYKSETIQLHGAIVTIKDWSVNGDTLTCSVTS